MATSTGPDLEGGRLAVEALMDDTCEISRPGDEDTESVDPQTLQFVAAAAETLYEGRCSIATANRPGQPVVAVGGDQRAVSGYQISLPLYEAPELKPGDLVVVTSSRRDPGLVGSVFKVDEVAYKTMAISRKAQLTLES